VTAYEMNLTRSNDNWASKVSYCTRDGHISLRYAADVDDTDAAVAAFACRAQT